MISLILLYHSYQFQIYHLHKMVIIITDTIITITDIGQTHTNAFYIILFDQLVMKVSSYAELQTQFIVIFVGCAWIYFPKSYILYEKVPQVMFQPQNLPVPSFSPMHIRLYLPNQAVVID
ncbi:Hypothetical_protein [Hexamita inflata]|uniref:Hypothetical_protein n=1 Tax=Hexamita inflata TaxID=28002 RepID=A0AA86RRF1_9EUKA|nr:Hypothetical protein HINF_LOCUS64344 [Hexamita inflata]